MESHRNKGKGSRSSKNVNSQSLNEQPVVVIGTGEKSKNDVEGKKRFFLLSISAALSSQYIS